MVKYFCTHGLNTNENDHAEIHQCKEFINGSFDVLIDDEVVEIDDVWNFWPMALNNCRYLALTSVKFVPVIYEHNTIITCYLLSGFFIFCAQNINYNTTISVMERAD